MNVIDKINAKYVKNDVPEFRVGDTVRVDVKIIEGKRERIQAFEGVVVARRAAITVIRKGKVRRAKLNFLKGMVGSYRIKERGQK